jgi:hypothetical protein
VLTHGGRIQPERFQGLEKQNLPHCPRNPFFLGFDLFPQPFISRCIALYEHLGTSLEFGHQVDGNRDGPEVPLLALFLAFPVGSLPLFLARHEESFPSRRYDYE